MTICLCGCGEEVKKGRMWVHGHYVRINKPSGGHSISSIIKFKATKRIGGYIVAPLSLCNCGCKEIVFGGKNFISGHHMKTIEYKKRKSKSAKQQWINSSDEYKQQRKIISRTTMIKNNQTMHCCNAGGRVSVAVRSKNHIYDGHNFMSQGELDCYKLLKQKYSQIVYGYQVGTKTIDFFIPEKQIFIEYHPGFMGYKKKVDQKQYRIDRLNVLRNAGIDNKILFFESLNEVQDYVDFNAFRLRPTGGMLL